MKERKMRIWNRKSMGKRKEGRIGEEGEEDNWKMNN
jgi:hypothetical protein